MNRAAVWVAAALLSLSAGCGLDGSAHAQQPGGGDLDARVSRFLNDARGSWADLNVPYQDGKILHEIVVKGNFRRFSRSAHRRDTRRFGWPGRRRRPAGG